MRLPTIKTMPDNQAPISRSRPDPVMPQPKSLGGFSKSKFGRAILATPFLFLAVSCFRAMDLDSIRAFLEPRALSGRIEWDGGTIPILQQFHNVRFLDDLWRGTTVAFAPSALGFDAVSWWQMFTFLNDFTVLYSISLVESARRANSVTASQL